MISKVQRTGLIALSASLSASQQKLSMAMHRFRHNEVMKVDISDLTYQVGLIALDTSRVLAGELDAISDFDLGMLHIQGEMVNRKALEIQQSF
ncbi:hypothetical protein HNP46_005701 [Pseudomonas nitritireducens]|uniref:Uncharacterized protein n=1 Tax=Pseudomonas nitroreducens TaxID=46680 RepID=A0A7W7P4E4_PSENT|nr:hypothetical protein [Pseudomonas nitritireducens]MBB4866794.1 hypothetical protein [Pseudomonas nitritireducens]